MGRLLSGDTVFNAVLLSCFFSSLIVPYVFRLALACFELRTARVAAAIGFLLPDWWFYGSCLLRDMAIGCLAAMVICQVVTGLQRPLSYCRLGWAALLNFGVVLYLRPELSFLLLGICCVWLVAEHITRPSRLMKFALPAVAVVVVCLLVPPTRDRILTHLEWLFAPERLAYRLNVNAELGAEQAASGSLGGKVLRLPMVIRLPILFGHSLLQLPTWAAINSYGWAPIAIAGSVADTLWLGFVIFLPSGLVGCLRHAPRRALWVWGTAIAMLLLMAYTASIMPRWRLMVMPCLLILVAHGMLLRRYHKLAVASALSIAVLLALVLFLKS
jgi:hypothetical protein